MKLDKKKITKIGLLKAVVLLVYIALIFLIQDDNPSIVERRKMHCERIERDEEYRLKVAVNRYFNDILLDIKMDKDRDWCDPDPNDKFPNLMDCELAITGKNIDENVLNSFIGNLILQHHMMASSADLDDTFVQYSENILSQMNPAEFWKLDFMEILKNHNIMYLFYGTELSLYEKSSFSLGGEQKKQLIIHSKVGGNSDSQYMWNTIRETKVDRYQIENCGNLRYLFNLE
ncbi:hypothetical protein EV697_101362 [Bisgaardia hudsonensis]|uniref:Uncharacterized protein n=1 Tax=Bisgaardia hudsonensis TaxID=109472 RepID=A0A4R2N324_9PAST|nr:hypothetical protein [Bisgaardia hudsonensis]QLB12679.1 hypothetical protein A6A11_03190 [Bisgaardia hudsonensis]TCP14225.1 hypothetical protein EV697_101362 [Bisgaardia hudsonensis]